MPTPSQVPRRERYRTEFGIDGPTTLWNRFGLCSAQEGHIPGDPQECRERTRRCAQIAANVATPFASEVFADLAQSWLKLAADLERSQDFLTSIAEMGGRKSS